MLGGSRLTKNLETMQGRPYTFPMVLPYYRIREKNASASEHRMSCAPGTREATELRSTVHERSLKSFTFFARHVLGLRRLSLERCEALKDGAKPNKTEAHALASWHALREQRRSDLPTLVQALTEP